MGEYERSVNMKAVVVLSGGMDSTTLLYYVLDKGYSPYAISFNYGQKHKREIECAKKTCKKLGVQHFIIDLKVINLVSPSSLTRENWEVPEGHYTSSTMNQTVVPMRNMLMLSVVSAFARGMKITKIFYGAHSGDHEIYWDCRKRFLDGFNNTVFDQSSNAERGTLTPEFVRAFWECEGTLGQDSRHTTKEKDREFWPIVLFTQNDRVILEEIKKFFFNRGCVHSKGIHKKSGKEMFAYKLFGHDCRLFIDLMKDSIKLEKRQEQFRKWYEEHQYFFEKIPGKNHGKGDKKYTIVQDGIEVIAPFLKMDKGDIAILGKKLNVDYSLTHTCYKGKVNPCMKCGACVERIEAFQKAEMKDPLVD